jgi:hypothetical protein
MSVIAFPTAGSGGGLLLGEAVDRFLERFRDEPGTAVTYAETLARLTAVAGDDLPAAQLRRRRRDGVRDHHRYGRCPGDRRDHQGRHQRPAG